MKMYSEDKKGNSKKKLWCFLLAMMLVIPCLQGCTERRSKIAYTVYPIGYLLQRIAGNTIDCISIQQDHMVVQRAQIRSDYEKTLRQSYVLFHIGDLEPYLSVFHDEIARTGVQDVDLSADNAVYDFGRYVPADPEKGTLESFEPYYHGDAFTHVDMNAKDLSLWIDPIAMMSMGRDIRDWLIQENPNEESFYADNYRKLEDDLINLDAQYQNLSSQVSSSRRKIAFASMTPSFGNWQKTYGFAVYPVVLSKYGVLPDEQQLKIIENRIQSDGVSYIVREPDLPDDMTSLCERVRKDCSLKEVSLSSLSSESELENKDGKDYLSIMYENLNTLQQISEDSVSN